MDGMYFSFPGRAAWVDTSQIQRVRMHTNDNATHPHCARASLRATLHRLQRHLEDNRHREQAALEVFGTWQAQWSERREVISQRMEWLDRELSQLAIAAMPVPPLSLLSVTLSADSSGDLNSAEEFEPDDEEHETHGIITPPGNPWQRS